MCIDEIDLHYCSRASTGTCNKLFLNGTEIFKFPCKDHVLLELATTLVPHPQILLQKNVAFYVIPFDLSWFYEKGKSFIICGLK